MAYTNTFLKRWIKLGFLNESTNLKCFDQHLMTAGNRDMNTAILLIRNGDLPYLFEILTSKDAFVLGDFGGCLL